MHRRLDNRSGSVAPRWRRWLERLFVIAGAGLLAWCALILADARLAQQNARLTLAMSSRTASLAPALGAERTASAPPAPTLVRTGDAVADLSIPRVELSVVVLEGSDPQTLRRGPGHLEGTPLPGESGNVVIAGHRDTFFRPLRDVRRGDDVFVTTPQGRVQYTVTSLRVVNPRDLSVLKPTRESTLTLITCFPFWVLGDAPDRYVVQATRVVSPAAATSATMDAMPPSEPIR
jgi:sortase A